MFAAAAMTRDVIVVPPEFSLAAAWRILCFQKIRHLPVVRAGALVGMVSDRDILVRASRDFDGVIVVPKNLIVGDAMTPTPLATCEVSTDVAEIARMMTQRAIDAVPVVQGLRLVGLVTSADLLHLLIRSEEARPLPFGFRLVENPQFEDPVTPA